MACKVSETDCMHSPALRRVPKTTMPVPEVERSLYKAAHLPKMSGKSHPIKEITRSIFFRYKKVRLMHPERGFL